MNLSLEFLDGELSILKISPDAPIPAWLSFSAKPLVSVTHTPEELSIVCPSNLIPIGLTAEHGWSACRIVGQLEFSAVGILAAIAAPLCAAKIPIFAIATFDTDYVLVRTAEMEQVKNALRNGFQFLGD